MKNLINDYKNGLDEISVLLQELRAYTTIKGLDKKTVEDIINHIENITDELDIDESVEKIEVMNYVTYILNLIHFRSVQA